MITPERVRQASVLLILFFLSACEINLQTPADEAAIGSTSSITGVKAVLSGNTVKVTWNAPPEIAGYEIARRVDKPAPASIFAMLRQRQVVASSFSEWETLTVTVTPSYSEVLSATGVYEYRVRGTAKDGSQTDWSQSALVEYDDSPGGTGTGTGTGGSGGSGVAADLTGEWVASEYDDDGAWVEAALDISCADVECSITWWYSKDLMDDGTSEGDIQCDSFGSFDRAANAVTPAWTASVCQVYTASGWVDDGALSGSIPYRHYDSRAMIFDGVGYTNNVTLYYPFVEEMWAYFPGGTFDPYSPFKVLMIFSAVSPEGPYEIEFGQLHDVNGSAALDEDTWFGRLTIDETSGNLIVEWTARLVRDGDTGVETELSPPGNVTWPFTHDEIGQVLTVSGDEYRTLDYWFGGGMGPYYPFDADPWAYFPSGTFDPDGEGEVLSIYSDTSPSGPFIIEYSRQSDVVGNADLDLETFTGSVVIDDLAGTLDITWSSYSVDDGNSGSPSAGTPPAGETWNYAYYPLSMTLYVQGVTYHTFSYWLSGGTAAVGSGSYSATSSAYSWNSAADPGNGIELISANADDTAEFFALPFTITVYGIVYDQLTVASNGVVQFGANSSSFCCSGSLPSFDAPASIALNWRDLVVQANGSIRYAVMGTEPNRELIVTFYNMTGFGESTDQNERYQLVVLESQSDRFTIRYQTVAEAGAGGINLGDGIESTSWTPTSATAFTVVPQ